jgi:hypothetical protein
MTLDELKSLKYGEIVVITKVDGLITEYHNYQVGDELIFSSIDSKMDSVNFVKRGYQKKEYPVMSHFTYEFCHYIERKVVLERDKKINKLLKS